MKSSFLTSKTFSMTAGQFLTLAVTGAFVNCTASTAPFQLSFGESSEKIPFENGLKRQLAGNEIFHKLTLENTSASTNTITLYIGTGDFSDDRLVITAASALPVTRTVKPASVYGPFNFNSSYAAGGLATNFTQLSILVTSGSITINGVTFTVGMTYDLQGCGNVAFSNPAINATGGTMTISGLTI